MSSGHRGNPRGGGRGQPRGGGPSRGSGYGPRGGGSPGGGRSFEPEPTSLIFDQATPHQIPPRLSQQSLAKFITDNQPAKTGPKRLTRPGFGTAGAPIKLRSNFFAVKLPDTTFYSYTVQIEPATKVAVVQTRIFELLEEHPSFAPIRNWVAHDSSQQLVSSRQLPQPLAIPVVYFEPPNTQPLPNAKTYTVTITFDKNLPTSDLKSYVNADRNYKDYNISPFTSALNLILQAHARRTGVKVGRGSNKFFFPNERATRLSEGLEAWRGFYISIRPSFKELMVNVNVCTTAFVEPGNLADILRNFSRGSHGGMPTLPKAMVTSIRVRLLHSGYKKKLFAIGTRSARNEMFDCPELGGRISVETFFKRKYGNLPLKYAPVLPVVNVGTKIKPQWIPAELCVVERGCVFKGKLSSNQTAEMIKIACQKPVVNANAITQRGFPALALSGGSNSTLQEFGITIESKMADLPGRELPAPTVTYGGQGGNIIPKNGAWNIVSKKFHKAGSVTTWWLLDTVGLPISEGSPMRRLAVNFMDKLKASGLPVQKFIPEYVSANMIPPNEDPGRQASLLAIKHALQNKLQGNKPKPSFILVLLGGIDNFLYPGIKKIGDVDLGIATVCMLTNKAFNDQGNKQDQYLSNVALKVNIKLGGFNHSLARPTALHQPKTMMVGIDVTHPGPGSRPGTPSIAAVVANTGNDFVQFPASLRIQESKKEMLDVLWQMLIDRLQAYFKANSRTLPDRILIYRDGVSEGQFDSVLEEELPQIFKAFEETQKALKLTSYRPKLSIIICGKRHHAKFWPAGSEHADKNGNTRPGTVVDQGVTGVYDYDFYLQAHAGLQGHVKATHYTVIYDENKLTPDQIQVGTHDGSYLYARATKAVSLMPPAYYADLACERGRCYLNDFLVDDKTTVVSGGSKADKDREAQKVFEAASQAWGAGVHPDLRHTMFYI